jgi:tRNA threonylcarbamoyladenosine biosynthesis protein TsaB
MSQDQQHILLLINTALQEASVGLSVNGQLVDQLLNHTQHEHASFLHPAIASICKKNNIQLKELNAISVINGPGSYTGLRVGLSAAKGICYANQLPLICINTLEWIAFGNSEQATDLIAPMIDARRMEVFTAIYTKQFEVGLSPTNLILEEQSYSTALSGHHVLFVGDGAPKWKTICKHPNAHFAEACHTEDHHAGLASIYFKKGSFASLFSAAPYYTKEFYNTQKG